MVTSHVSKLRYLLRASRSARPRPRMEFGTGLYTTQYIALEMRQGLHMQQHTMQPSTKKKEEKEWGRWLSPSRLPLIDNWKPSSPCCSIDLMNSRLVYYYILYILLSGKRACKFPSTAYIRKAHRMGSPSIKMQFEMTRHPSRRMAFVLLATLCVSSFFVLLSLLWHKRGKNFCHRTNTHSVEMESS